MIRGKNGYFVLYVVKNWLLCSLSCQKLAKYPFICESYHMKLRKCAQSTTNFCYGGEQWLDRGEQASMVGTSVRWWGGVPPYREAL